MKKYLEILILVIVWSTCFYAQNQTSKTYDMRNDSPNVKRAESNEFVFEGSVSERFITTAVVIGEIIILVFVVFYWKKTKNESKADPNSIFKKNIQAIREEKVKPIINKKYSVKRRTLNDQLKIKSINGKLITSKAKKLSIAKGELFLAARIQQLQNQTR